MRRASCSGSCVLRLRFVSRRTSGSLKTCPSGLRNTSSPTTACASGMVSRTALLRRLTWCVTHFWLDNKHSAINRPFVWRTIGVRIPSRSKSCLFHARQLIKPFRPNGRLQRGRTCRLWCSQVHDVHAQSAVVVKVWHRRPWTWILPALYF